MQMNLRRFRNLQDAAWFQYIAIVLFAVAYAMVCEIFVFPNHFAPSGVNGIATMVQYLFDFEVGYLSLIINIPMLIAAYFVLQKSYAVRTLVFVAWSIKYFYTINI